MRRVSAIASGSEGPLLEIGGTGIDGGLGLGTPGLPKDCVIAPAPATRPGLPGGTDDKLV